MGNVPEEVTSVVGLKWCKISWIAGRACDLSTDNLDNAFSRSGYWELTILQVFFYFLIKKESIV